MHSLMCLSWFKFSFLPCVQKETGRYHQLKLGPAGPLLPQDREVLRPRSGM